MLAISSLLTQPGTRAAALALAAALGLLACADLTASEDAIDAALPPPFMPPVCFAAGTLIATPDGPLPIEQLAEGRAVWSFDHGANQLVVGRVTATSLRPGQPYGSFPVPDDAGTTLRLTAEHPIFARGRYIKAKCVHAGDELRVLRDGGVQRVPARAGFTPIPDASTAVYNLTVSPQENYFAGDLLVHNKSYCSNGDCRPRPLCGTGWGVNCAPGCPCNLLPDAGMGSGLGDAGAFFAPVTRDAGTSDAGDECAPEGS